MRKFISVHIFCQIYDNHCTVLSRSERVGHDSVITDFLYLLFFLYSTTMFLSLATFDILGQTIFFIKLQEVLKAVNSIPGHYPLGAYSAP